MKHDMTHIDPNALPAQMERREIASINHHEGRRGKISYDKLSLTLNIPVPGEGPQVTNDKPIQVFKGKWTGDPERQLLVDPKFLNRDQPFVGTCSRPIQGRNMGCFAHNGCPYTNPEDPRGRGPGPFNVVMQGPDGEHHACPCYHFYTGLRRGFPTAQVHYFYDGYRVDQEVITEKSVKAKKSTDEWGDKCYEDIDLDIQIENLGPMYSHHFGGSKQEARAELPLAGREDAGGIPIGDAIDDEAFESAAPIAPKPGRIADAPKSGGIPAVNLGLGAGKE